MDLSALLTSRTVAAIGLACIALSAFAALWALVKLSYQRALGRPMPRNALTGTLDVLAELATNVVGAVSRALKLGTGEGLFRPTVPLTPVEAVQAQAVEIARETVVPHDPTQTMRAPVDRDSQRGSVDLGALGFVLLLAVASGVALAHCTATRRFVLDHTDGVPARVRCAPRTQVCVLTDAGVYLPSVYSDECRPWPTHPRRPDGTQRTCAAGEGCVVEPDGGVAHCTAAP
jgi:hypothetical protein